MEIEKKIFKDIKKIGLPTVVWQTKGDHLVFLFNIDDSFTFCDFCDKNKIGFLGYDGFRIIGNMRQPDLSFICDSREVVSGAQIKKVLLKEIKDRPSEVKDMFFEFVLKRL